jgi:hypothetical protein
MLTSLPSARVRGGEDPGSLFGPLVVWSRTGFGLGRLPRRSTLARLLPGTSRVCGEPSFVGAEFRANAFHEHRDFADHCTDPV